VHIIYGISAIGHNLTSVLIYACVSGGLFVFFVILCAAFTCCKRPSKSDSLSLQENTALNETYIDYNTIDTNDATRWSKASFDTEHEFSYYDPIRENYRVSSLGTMKLLTPR
jgi:hypothetical protein